MASEDHASRAGLTGPDRPLVGTEGVDVADVGLVLRDVLDPGRPVEAGPEKPVEDIVHVWGMQSFPASDPPSNW